MEATCWVTHKSCPSSLTGTRVCMWSRFLPVFHTTFLPKSGKGWEEAGTTSKPASCIRRMKLCEEGERRERERREKGEDREGRRRGREGGREIYAGILFYSNLSVSRLELVFPYGYKFSETFDKVRT